jgi:hypothetical protein
MRAFSRAVLALCFWRGWFVKNRVWASATPIVASGEVLPSVFSAVSFSPTMRYGNPKKKLSGELPRLQTRVRFPSPAPANQAGGPTRHVGKLRGPVRHTSPSAQWPISTATGSEHMSQVITVIANASNVAPHNKQMLRTATASRRPRIINPASNNRLLDFLMVVNPVSPCENSRRSAAHVGCGLDRGMHGLCHERIMKGVEEVGVLQPDNH